MKLAAYLEIVSRREGHEVTLHDVMSLIVQQVHHASRFGALAIAFPTMGEKPGLGDKVRVFAESLETLNKVCDFFESNPRLDEYAIVRRAKPIPESPRSFEVFMQRRFSHGISAARRAKLGERASRLDQVNAEIREKQTERLNRFDSKGQNKSGIPFATVYSSTTKSQFKLHVERVPCEYSEGTPNGYGLSRKGNLVAIPVF